MFEALLSDLKAKDPRNSNNVFQNYTEFNFLIQICIQISIFIIELSISSSNATYVGFCLSKFAYTESDVAISGQWTQSQSAQPTTQCEMNNY